jgi:hypothetical protein
MRDDRIPTTGTLSCSRYVLYGMFTYVTICTTNCSFVIWYLLYGSMALCTTHYALVFPYVFYNKSNVSIIMYWCLRLVAKVQKYIVGALRRTIIFRCSDNRRCCVHLGVSKYHCSGAIAKRWLFGRN